MATHTTAIGRRAAQPAVSTPPSRPVRWRLVPPNLVNIRPVTGRPVDRRRPTADVARRGLILVLVSFVVAVAGLLAVPEVANARPDGGGGNMPAGGGGGVSICQQQAGLGNSSILPAMRWDDASSHLHSRLGGSVWDDIPQKIQRDGYTEELLSIGNFFWSTADGITEESSRFCPLDTAGGTVDQAAASVGKAILSSPIPVLGVVLALGMFLWRKRRGGANPKELIGTVLIIAVMAAMVAGAEKSKGAGAGGYGGAFQPGVLSPGWFVTRIDEMTSALASAPAQALNVVEINTDDTGDTGPLSCHAYVAAMKQQYTDLYGPKVTGQAASAVPMVIDGMWEESGLVAWKKAQFGGNQYGDYVYCRLLESFAATPFTTGSKDPEYENSVKGYMSRVPGVDANHLVAGALAWRQANDDVEQDRQMIGWAACQPDDPADPLSGSFKYSNPLLVPQGARGDANRLCKQFFTDPGWDGGEFDVPVDQDKVAEQAGSDPQVVQFINVMHGKDSSGGPVAAFAYALSGISVLVVFGVIAGAIILAKLAALVMMLGLFAVMIMSIFTRNGIDRVLSFVKQYVGMSFFVFGSTLVMSALALISKIAVDLGGSLLAGGADGLLATMWAGVSPLLAVVVLAAVFKKARIPSPLSLKGGLAWGAAAGGSAAAVGAGIDRITGAARHHAGRLGKVVVGRSAGFNAASGGRSPVQRTSRLSPETFDPQPAGTRITSGSGFRNGVRDRLGAMRRGADPRTDPVANAGRGGMPRTTRSGAVPAGPGGDLPSLNKTVDLDVGDVDHKQDGTLADRFETNKGKITREDIKDYWNGELSDQERAGHHKAVDRAARWQTAGALAAGAKSVPEAVWRHRRKVMLVGLGMAAAPAVLAAVPAGLAIGGVVAAGLGAGITTSTVRNIRAGHMIRRTFAMESTQMQVAKAHVAALQQERRKATIKAPQRRTASDPDAGRREQTADERNAKLHPSRTENGQLPVDATPRILGGISRLVNWNANDLEQSAQRSESGERALEARTGRHAVPSTDQPVAPTNPTDPTNADEFERAVRRLMGCEADTMTPAVSQPEPQKAPVVNGSLLPNGDGDDRHD